MAGRTVAVPADSAPAGHFFLGPHVIVDGVDCVEVADYSPNDADRQWREREIGDVPLVHWLSMAHPNWSVISLRLLDEPAP